jgi:hypothetical protein
VFSQAASPDWWRLRHNAADFGSVGIPHPVGDGFGLASEAYPPDASGPTGNSDYLGAEFKFDDDLDHLAEFIVAEPVPEVLEPQLPIAVGQSRVESELKREDQVALPNLVFADNHEVLAGLNLEVGKVCEVFDFELGNAHDFRSWHQLYHSPLADSKRALTINARERRRSYGSCS